MFVGGAEGGLDLLTKKRKRGFQKSTTMHFCLNIYSISENCDNSSSSHHTVMHDFIPIFPCDNAEENSDGFSCCGEVGMSVIGGHKQMCQFLPKHPLHDWTFCISRQEMPYATCLCSLHIWPFQREQLQRKHSRGGGGTCPRWWRSSCTCSQQQSAAASSVSPSQMLGKAKVLC